MQAAVLQKVNISADQPTYV